MKKILALTLALMMLLAALAACTTPPEETDATDTEIVETDDPNLVTIIKKDESTKYMIIYEDNLPTTLKSIAQGIAYQINAKCKTDIFAYTEDVSWGCPNSSDLEILIGNTTREESALAAELLKGARNEYAIKFFDNGKIAIVASSNDALLAGANYFLSTFVTESGYTDSIKIPKNYEYYFAMEEADAADTWKLSLPVYEGGYAAPRTYSIGRNGTFSSNGNTGKLQVVAETNADEFNAYIEKLKAEGYTETAHTEVNGNLYYQFVKGTKSFYIYYTAFCGEARVIEDYSSTPENKFEYTYTPKAGETAAIYQYGMMQNPTGQGGPISETKRYENNGAFLIIRLSDNSLILIDGGRPDQATVAATEGLMDFLFEITGVDKESEDKIRIAALFYSHGDGDHLNFTYNLLANDKYTDRLDIERIMHNIPPDAVGGVDTYFPKIGTLLYSKYPDVKYLKMHTGQSIQLADATIDVIYTHEDMVDAATGQGKLRDNNLLSTMFMLTINGKKFFAMGDWGVGAGEEIANIERFNLCEERLLGMYKDAEGNYPALECDILQVAHHAINDNNKNVHAAVKADYAFFSQQDIKYEDLAHNCYRNIINQLREAGMEDKHMYFQGRQTNWLTIDQDGNITHGYKKLEGADEGYYYYKAADGKIVYVDYKGTPTFNASGNEKYTDTTGDAVFEDLENVTAYYVKGYWELLEPYEPFYPANNV